MAHEIEQNDAYTDKLYSWRQIRDTIAGSDSVKRSAELYLPMPSGMMDTDSSPSISTTTSNNDRNHLSIRSAPWWHPNPAYRAYLQRARFPDITANAHRGIMGFATRNDPEIELPESMSYMLKNADNSGNDLPSLYINTVSEVLQVGKQVLVLDINPAGEFYIAQYAAENNTDWEYITVNGEFIYTKIALREPDDDGKYDDTCMIIREYELIDGVVVSSKYKNGELIVGSFVEMSYKGKPFTRIPVVCPGAMRNTPEPGVCPLQGISDIAIAVYQEYADLRQAHFMTCNPTLFVFGVSDKETPKMLGSSVVVGIKNPAGNAMYPATDTSALDHIRVCVKDLHEEAVAYGASLISNSTNRESGDALGIRRSAQGSNLVHLINNVSKAYTFLMKMAAELSGNTSDEIGLEGNTEFAEKTLTPQDITALVTGWLQGAWDQDTVLDNMRDAGYIDAEKTNEDIKNNIDQEPPLVDETTDPDNKTKTNGKSKKDEIDTTTA